MCLAAAGAKSSVNAHTHPHRETGAVPWPKAKPNLLDGGGLECKSRSVGEIMTPLQWSQGGRGKGSGGRQAGRRVGGWWEQGH